VAAVTAPRGPVTLHQKYEPAAGPGQVMVSGIEALVRLVLEVRWLDRARALPTAAYLSGYEGSPLGGLDQELQRAGADLAAVDAVFRPGLNEELAATAVAGTQLLGRLPGRRVEGVTGFWYGKNPGLDRAADAIRHANLAGTAPLGGAVAFVGDDPACKSSTLPSACEALARSLGLPLLAPASVEEIPLLGLHAVALSRAAGVWVGLKIVADLADGAATVDVPLSVGDVPHPDPARDFPSPLLVGPAALAAEDHLVSVRLPAARAYAAAHGLNRVVQAPARARLCLVAPGLAWAQVVRALDDLGLDGPARDGLGLRLVKLSVPWPLDPGHLAQLVGPVPEVLVVEEKGPFVEDQLRAALYGRPGAPRILGAADREGRPLLPPTGPLTADVVAGVLGRVLPPEGLGPRARAHLDRLAGAGRPRPASVPVGLRPRRAPDPSVPPTRSPAFCPGCPHNRSTRAADDQLVGLGIGCHIMAGLDAEGRGLQVGLTQMGGEGAQWNGLAPFTDDRHYVQNLGDGTFFHSGSLALRAAVAAGVSITYKLLFNQAVAMTGGQQPVGQMGVPELTRWLALEGVARVVVVTPEPGAYRRIRLDPRSTVAHRDDLAGVEAELAAVDGVTVLLYDDRCAAEERRLRARGDLPAPAERIWINQRVCEGCGDCEAHSSCLSLVPVATEFGRKTAVHQGSCNFDRSCLDGDCPSFVLVRPGRRAGRAGARRRRPRPPQVAPPDHRPDRAVIRMPGIGGTGVVTASRILQMAAHLSGRHAASVEQTGLAQKGGPVLADLRIDSTPVAGAVRVGSGGADLILGFDLYGTAAEAILAVADPARTTAVVNTTTTPTAAMVHHPGDVPVDEQALVGRIRRSTRAGGARFVAAGEVAERLVGQAAAANLVLVGAADQLGLLPLEAGSLEEAVRLNGVAVAQNLAALAWGRAAVALPQTVAEALAGDRRPAAPAATPTLPDAVPAALAPLVAHRAGDLGAYQSRRYARRYLARVAEVAAREQASGGPPDLPVTTAYAEQLHRLMAYKDEYEVARLHRDPAERRRREEALGPGSRSRVLLRPPVLAALGLRRKISLGPLSAPAFAVLSAGRHLRGTPLDPFGHTALRRRERALPQEYTALVLGCLSPDSPDGADRALRAALLPDRIRGYEAVKRAALAHYDEGVAALGAPVGSGRPA
jgi:indolepyruvate ferredoxin oxidoreductase